MTMVKVKTKACPMCQKEHEVEVNQDDLRDYLMGKGEKRFIQNAFPYLTPAQREQIVSGYDDSCWKKLWAEPLEELG